LKRWPEPADASLSEALRLGEPQGYLRTFIDHVPLIERSLRRVEAQGYTYVQRILSAGEGAARPVESLTQRELEVMSLLAHGATNQGIASTLVVGVGTVKSHINHIMSKLNAHNRTEAVALARELQLID
jgi:LuxR family maltose regulon positive regulatory protein